MKEGCFKLNTKSGENILSYKDVYPLSLLYYMESGIFLFPSRGSFVIVPILSFVNIV